MLLDGGIEPCSGQENSQESVALNCECWTRRLRKCMKGRENIWGKRIPGRKEDWGRSPNEYRNWEAVAPTICIKWAAGKKEEAGKGFKRKVWKWAVTAMVLSGWAVLIFKSLLAWRTEGPCSGWQPQLSWFLQLALECGRLWVKGQT